MLCTPEPRSSFKYRLYTLLSSLWFVLFYTIGISCNDTQKKTDNSKPSNNHALPSVKSDYKSVAFIDSFFKANKGEIEKNTALRKRYEDKCTQILRPLIEKRGLYDDIPFQLVATTSIEDKSYGNFIFNDDKHFIKVQCIIKDDQLPQLQENKQYFIKFKMYQIEEGVSFENSFSTVQLPIVNAYLTSFTPL